MQRGYSGFSYADVSDAIAIRKASIHHHFPAKSDLAIAVVKQSREGFAADMGSLRAAGADAPAQLRAYIAYWARCITDGSASFCVAGMLAAELTILPQPLAAEVRSHFDDVTSWLASVLALGVESQHWKLSESAENAAASFVSLVYGAMLIARAFNDPAKFVSVTDEALAKIFSYA